MKLSLNIISTILLTLFCSLAHTQQYTWSETEFTIPGEDATEAYKLRTFDGGDLICATTSQSFWNNFMYLIKLDSAGNQEWTQRYAIDMRIQHVIQCPDSCYVVSGEDGNNWTGYQVIKLDQNGNVVYNKQLYSWGHPTMMPPFMLARNNNNIYFGSTVVDSGGSNWHWHIFELDPQGNVLSSDIYHNHPVTTELVALDTFSNGDLFVAGAWLDTNLGQFCPLIDRIDTSGALVWSKKFSASTSAFKPQCITKAGTDKFIVSTHYLRPVPFGYTGGMTYFKMDGSGNVLWSKRYEDYVVQFGEIITLPNAQTCVIGGDMGYKTFFLRLDSTGNLLYSSCFQWRYLSSFDTLANGNLTMCGINYNNKKIVIEKTSPFAESCNDSTYTFVQGGFSMNATSDSGHTPIQMAAVETIFPFTSPNIQMSVVCSSVDVPEPIVNVPEINVMYGEYEIIITSSEPIVQLETFDSNGKLVRVLTPGSAEVVVSTNGLAPGVYFLNTSFAEGNRTTKIFIGSR